VQEGIINVREDKKTVVSLLKKIKVTMMTFSQLSLHFCVLSKMEGAEFEVAHIPRGNWNWSQLLCMKKKYWGRKKEPFAGFITFCLVAFPLLPTV